MCQLLGMNCAGPTDFEFSFRGFCKRGGQTDVHAHGWGLSVYGTTSLASGLQSFHDTLPACQSPIAQFLQQYPMRTYNMMAHIRYATQGQVSLENVHPFIRVWKGIQMCFCHNGEVPQFSTSNKYGSRLVLLGKAKNHDQSPELLNYHPVGDTDSEAVFCAILNAMCAEFPLGLPSLPVLHEFLQSICDEIIEQHHKLYNNDEMPIILNFLLGCGPYTQFAYSMPGKRPGSKVWNGLHYIVRQPPFTTARLLDIDENDPSGSKAEIDFATVTTPTDRVAVITTKPLTHEKDWIEFQPGQLILFDHGLPYTTPQSCDIVQIQGRGLYSKTVPLKYVQVQKNDPNRIENNNNSISNNNNCFDHDNKISNKNSDSTVSELSLSQQQLQQKQRSVSPSSSTVNVAEFDTVSNKNENELVVLSTASSPVSSSLPAPPITITTTISTR